MSNRKLEALGGLSWRNKDEIEAMKQQKRDEWKKKDEDLKLHQDRMNARSRMPARERESAESFQRAQDSQELREELKTAPSKSMLDEFLDMFDSDQDHKHRPQRIPPPGRAPRVPGFHG